MLRVAHAIPVYAPAWQFGGPVLSVSRLCEGLVREGISVRVITTNAGLPDWPSEELGRSTMENGVEVIRYPVDQQNRIIRSRALQQALPDILSDRQLIHLSGIWQPLGISIQTTALRLNIPVLHSIRGALGPYSFARSWPKKLPYMMLRERPLLQKAAGLHLTSQQEREEIKWLRLKAHSYILPNPVDSKHLKINPELRQRWRSLLNIKGDTPLLLICGRQHHKKGLDLLPEVLVSQRHKPWYLMLVGGDDDGSGAALRECLRTRGLEDRLIVETTMPAADLVGIYNAADLMLLPSRHENFGNVVIEALSCGCAVQISDRTGVAADLLAGSPGSFGAVLPRKTEPWIQWLGKWLQKPERASAATVKWVQDVYGQQGVARGAIDIYQKILDDQAIRKDFNRQT